MSDKCIGNEKGKLSLKSKVLLGALALTVIVGLGSAAYGASDNKTNVLLLKQMRIFDPFTLKSKRVTVTRSENENVIDPGLLDKLLAPKIYVIPDIVRVPYRPALRSSFRPPLILLP